MDRLQSARVTISLVNLAADTLTNRFKKAHAEAWFVFKYTNDDQCGIPVPPNFVGMVMPSIEFVGFVRERRGRLAGEQEFQDVAPDPLDAQQSSDERSEEDPEESSEEDSEDAYSDEDDLPECQSD